jgi:hypothetical protein
MPACRFRTCEARGIVFKKLDDLGVDLPMRVRLQLSSAIPGERSRLGSDAWTATKSIRRVTLLRGMASAMPNLPATGRADR